MRFIHTADIHLDSPLKGLEVHDDAPVDEIRGATRRAFDNLVELAIENKVAFVLIAGDLYDGDWKDYNTALFFAGRMGRLDKAGIRVFVVSGNHDAASRITRAMPLPDNVTLFSSRKPQTVHLDHLEVAVHGMSYSSRAENSNLAARYPRPNPNCFNIGLLHTSLTGREGHEDYAPCTEDDLRSKGYDYWALGHVHKREIVSQDPWIIFPGNIQGRHIRETGHKGATMVTVEDGRIMEVGHHELDLLRWAVCSVDLSECDTGEAVYEQVRSAMQKEQDQADGKTLALRLRLEGSCSLHAELHSRADQWVEEFRGIAVSLGDIWLEKVQFATRRLTSLEEIAGEDTPLSALLQAIADLEFSSEVLTTLVPELAGLKTKLPPELLDADSMLEKSPDQLTELREEIRELLIARLIRHRREA
jgi:DNA repair exonuclease SbcCD nuclease subunit